MSSRWWTGPEQRRLFALVEEGLDTEQIAIEMGRTKQSIKQKCHKLGISISRHEGVEGMPWEWNRAYVSGLKSRHTDACPFSKSDLYLFCAWMAGRNDSQMGYRK